MPDRQPKLHYATPTRRYKNWRRPPPVLSIAALVIAAAFLGAWLIVIGLSGFPLAFVIACAAAWGILALTNVAVDRWF